MSQVSIILTVVVFTVLVVLGGMVAKIIVGRRREADWAQRRVQLFNKYHDEDTVEKIMSRMIWKHMTRDQLIDSWGAPAQEEPKDETGSKQVIRYRPMPGRPNGQRVILENGRVIGWDTKRA
jgi:hypothetical protein